jgi:hypothetical protein
VTDMGALVLAGADQRDLTTLAGYREIGGYEQLALCRERLPSRTERIQPGTMVR